jgi:protein tyrosine/serine phosphatase
VAQWTQRLNTRYRTLRASYKCDLSTAENARRAASYQYWFDHGGLRTFWTNMSEISEGVWRSNHPEACRFGKLHALGIKSVISLRGSTTAPWALLEQRACHANHMTLHTIALQSRRAPLRCELQKLIALFRSTHKPFVMHCKSGADRAGLASAIYLLVIDGADVATARKMLSLRYLHMRWSKTGVLGLLLDTFDASGEPDFEVWLQTYDAETLQNAFDARR